jgi:hypothetical protein
MVVEGFHGNRGLLLRARASDFWIFLALPGRTPVHRDRTGRESAMELVHPRCAGLDVSKRDAKVCVRVAGAGRAAAASTVTTWGAVTSGRRKRR